jgi:CheY-like chemotaxis protein
VLTDLRVFSRSLVPGAPGWPLERSITETSSLELSHAASVVTFEFAALNLVVPEKGRYRYRLEGVDSGWSEPSVQRSVEGQAIRGQGRILVLDGEEYVRDVCQQTLADLGYEVTSVSTGEEAVAAFREARASPQPFDAVILDLTIPGGIGGLGVLSRLRVIDPDVLAIASSGYSSDTVMAEPGTHGFRDRLRKPYTAAELGEVVARVLGRKR